MNTAEQNYRLLQEIEASRMFLLMACQQNSKLLERSDARIKQILETTELYDRSLAQALPQSERKSLSLSKQRGISLIELIIFMIIISVAVAGVLLVMNKVTGQSSDALIRKQALAIAESLLEEVELMSFTYCDPNDPSGNAGDPVLTTSTASCTLGWSQNVITGPIPNTETRYSAAAPFDNVADYSAFNMAPILDIAGNGVGLANYTANVAIARAGVAFLGVADDGAALRITVTVTGPGNTTVTLDGYRSRYAPNGLP